jgi:SAM-dependent methyltransferase
LTREAAVVPPSEPSEPTAASIFGAIYETAHWEGGSGQGSRADVTAVYRAVVETIIGAADVRTVVDAGCGDWEFAHLIDWSPVMYRGVDVVPAVVEHNRERFESPAVTFECRDFAVDELPPADLLLCKDVLQHWPLAWVQSFLRRVKRRYRYLLLTNDIASVHWPTDQVNAEIELGAWRTLDLERTPFDLRPDWFMDYDIRGEWTKRVVLVVRRPDVLLVRRRGDSGLNRLRRAGAELVRRSL